MKKWIRTNLAVLLLTVLLLTVTVITAYIGLGKTPSTPQAPPPVASEEASLEGPRDAKTAADCLVGCRSILSTLLFN